MCSQVTKYGRGQRRETEQSVSLGPDRPTTREWGLDIQEVSTSEQIGSRYNPDNFWQQSKPGDLPGTTEIVDFR
jgi:hypothetical protein